MDKIKSPILKEIIDIIALNKISDRDVKKVLDRFFIDNINQLNEEDSFDFIDKLNQLDSGYELPENLKKITILLRQLCGVSNYSKNRSAKSIILMKDEAVFPITDMIFNGMILLHAINSKKSMEYLDNVIELGTKLYNNPKS